MNALKRWWDWFTGADVARSNLRKEMLERDQYKSMYDYQSAEVCAMQERIETLTRERDKALRDVIQSRKNQPSSDEAKEEKAMYAGYMNQIRLIYMDKRSWKRAYCEAMNTIRTVLETLGCRGNCSKTFEINHKPTFEDELMESMKHLPEDMTADFYLKEYDKGKDEIRIKEDNDTKEWLSTFNPDESSLEGKAMQIVRDMEERKKKLKEDVTSHLSGEGDESETVQY